VRLLDAPAGSVGAWADQLVSRFSATAGRWWPAGGVLIDELLARPLEPRPGEEVPVPEFDDGLAGHWWEPYWDLADTLIEGIRNHTRLSELLAQLRGTLAGSEMGHQLDELAAVAALCHVAHEHFGESLKTGDGPRDLVIAVANADSPLRRSTTELVAKSISPQRKALLGVALLGIARVAYPYPGRLEDVTFVGRFSVSGVVEYLNRIVGHLADQAGDPEKGRPDLDLAEVHRSWDAMGDARSESRRVSSSTKGGLVHRVSELLVDAGLARKASDDAGGTYRTTPRLTLMVRSMVADSEMYAALLAATIASVREEVVASDIDGDIDDLDNGPPT
jgi:hypothetical protein